ncbi:hypothetical protein HRbin04_00600 [archaeon HR04]|jgi:hypothetical protein|nr:hypothetical protein HRbin04_00600 [archaeon HR04]
MVDQLTELITKLRSVLNIREAKIYFDIAKQDLEASKTLYFKGYYPQAIFWLEQCVENIYKAYAVLFKVVKPKDVEHNAFLIGVKDILDAWEFMRSLFQKVKKQRNQPPNIQELKKAIDEYIEFMDSKITKSKFSELIKVKKQRNKEQNPLNELLDESLRFAFSPNFKDDLNKYQNILNQLEKNKLDYVISRYYCLDNLMRLSQINNGQEKEILKILNTWALFTTHVFFLTLILAPHTTPTRYPTKGYDPSRYSVGMPLIDNYCELVKLAEKSLEYYEQLNVLHN